jgi:dTDP-glucose 4,6-dehydratase
VLVSRIFDEYSIDTVAHIAAETHVDKSINDPLLFVTTNVVGTCTLLEIARRKWEKREDVIFHYVSTDEVYGALGGEGFFVETSPLKPRSPYAAC